MAARMLRSAARVYQWPERDRSKFAIRPIVTDHDGPLAVHVRQPGLDRQQFLSQVNTKALASYLPPIMCVDSQLRPFRSEQEVLSQIAQFSPAGGDWLPLERLLEDLWSVGVSEKSFSVLFGLFERFPDSDGAGVQWSIVHGVESLDIPYEQELAKSLAQCSSHMGNIMMSRLRRSLE